MQELSGVSEAAREQAMSRFRLLQPHLEENRPLQLVAADGKLPFRTAQRWVSQYRKFGLVALVRKSRDDRGSRRVISPKIKAAIEALALESPPLPVRSICRQARQFAEMIGEPLPRYGTVYALVRDVPIGLLTLAHRGGKVYSEEFDLVHRREAPRSNAIWQADHAQLNIRLIKEGGQIARPWLTIVIDDYSRAVAGYYLGFDPPSSTRTALALRQAIWRKGHPHWQVCGIPEVLYTDNGSDFTSKHIEQVAVDLKIRLVFSTPGKPQGRGRIYVTNFLVKHDAVLLELVTVDTTTLADGQGTRYRAEVNVKLPGLDDMTADDVKKTIDTIVTDPATASAVQSKTVKLGMTTDEVKTTLGNPGKVVDLGAKQIYVYPDMKIVFVDGKVSDVQ